MPTCSNHISMLASIIAFQGRGGMNNAASQTNPGGSILDKPLDKGMSSATFDPADMGMAPISASLMVAGHAAPAEFFAAMYNKEKKQVEMMPVCGRGDVFQPQWITRMEDAGMSKLYVYLAEAEAVQEYLERAAGDLIDAPDITRRKKMAVIQELASLNLRLVFGSDMSPRSMTTASTKAQTTVDQLLRVPELLTNLSSVLASDYSLYSHSVNCCMLAMAFGTYLHLPESRIHTLGVGGLLHDVGMAKLPKDLLRKKEELTQAEMRQIQSHVQIGYKLLMPVSSVSLDVLKIVLHHHENADGTGYPQGLHADRIPYQARVIRLVDAYVAMTSERPYRDLRGAFDAAAELIEAMTDHFGKDLVPPFIRFLGSHFVA